MLNLKDYKDRDVYVEVEQLPPAVEGEAAPAPTVNLSSIGTVKLSAADLDALRALLNS